MAHMNYSHFVKGATKAGLHRSDLGNYNLMQKIVGLQEEIGELSQLFNKQMRYATKVDTKEITSELGDILFYVVAIGQAYDISLEDIVRENVSKLTKRHEEN